MELESIRGPRTGESWTIGTYTNLIFVGLGRDFAQTKFLIFKDEFQTLFVITKDDFFDPNLIRINNG